MRSLLLLLAAACPLAAQPSAPVWAVSGTPALQIGDESDARKQFNRIGSVGRLSDGSIVVANGESQELRVFSARGDFVRALSRKGAGPGEFRMLNRFFVAGDTIVAPEANLGESSVSVFSPSGFVNRVLFKSPGRGGVTLVGRFPDGRMAVAPGFKVLPELPIGTMVMDSLRLGVMSLGEAATPEWIGSFPLRQIWLVDSPFVPGRPFPVDMPHGHYLGYAVSGDQLWVADSESGLVTTYASSGRQTGQFRLPVTQRPLRGDVLKAIWARELADVPATDKFRRARLEGLAKAPMPKAAPLFVELIPGQRGEMWLRLYSEESAAPSFVVVGPTGKTLARATLPSGFTLQQVGADEVLGVQRDADGVERVAAYTLHRR